MSDELPEGWHRATLSTLAAPAPNAFTIGPFGSNLKVSDYKDAGVPLVFVRDIRAERFGGEKTKYVSEAKARELSSHAVRPGDLLVTKMGEPPGDTAIYPLDRPLAIITADCIKLSANESLTSSEFLRLCMRSPFVKDRIVEQTVGVAQQKLSLARFREVCVPLPPLPEQHRIIEKVEALLDQVNRAKARLDRVPLILKRFRQAVLAAACSGKLTQDWREAHADTSVEPLLKDLNVEPEPSRGEIEIPETWAWVPFASIVENHDGRRVPVKSSDREKRRGKYPYYGASGAIDTIDNFLFDGTFLLIGEDGANLLSRSTPIAFTAEGRFWVNNHAHVVQPRPGVVHGFLEAQFNGIDLQDYVTGTAQPKLTQGALNGIPIALPPTGEQEEIVGRVRALFHLAEVVGERTEHASSRVRRLAQAVLAKAFSGELVPTEAELARAEGRGYETAAELLERIRQAEFPSQPNGKHATHRRGAHLSRSRSRSAKRRGSELLADEA